METARITADKISLFSRRSSFLGTLVRVLFPSPAKIRSFLGPSVVIYHSTPRDKPRRQISHGWPSRGGRSNKCLIVLTILSVLKRVFLFFFFLTIGSRHSVSLSSTTIRKFLSPVPPCIPFYPFNSTAPLPRPSFSSIVKPPVSPRNRTRNIRRFVRTLSFIFFFLFVIVDSVEVSAR